MTRYERLAQIINDNDYKKIAEIGVWQGETYKYLTSNCKIDEYYAIDHDPKCDKIYGTNFMIMESVQASKQIQDEFLDLVFIDADHQRKSVHSDIINWFPKVRNGGMICGHDYDNPEHEGVRKAVDEIFNSSVMVDEDCFMWMVKK